MRRIEIEGQPEIRVQKSGGLIFVEFEWPDSASLHLPPMTAEQSVLVAGALLNESGAREMLVACSQCSHKAELGTLCAIPETKEIANEENASEQNSWER